MNVIIRTPALSMQASGYVIKSPLATTNVHTITDSQIAADVLNLTSSTAIYDLKSLIRGTDFTFISTRELSRIGSELGRLGLIDKSAIGPFIAGNMAFDQMGQQTDKDVKYNAVAMFNQMFEDNRAYARAWPMYAHQESFKFVTRELLSANQAINALLYFAYSDRSDLSISIKA